MNHELDESLQDEQRRRFLVKSSGVLGGIGVLCALAPLVSSWMPSARTRALGAPVHVDLQSLSPGEQLTVLWQGKPVWVIRRTQAMLTSLACQRSALRDPDSLVHQQPVYAQNSARSINPEYLVLVGLCTHLACVPLYKPQPHEVSPDWLGGFSCPCHGSCFDLAGRVFKDMLAPVNLLVQPYRFVNAHTILIGEDSHG